MHLVGKSPELVGYDATSGYIKGFPGGSSDRDLPASAGDIRDLGSIPESRRFPGGGNGNQPQYPCLKNPMDRRAWWATGRGVAESWTG